MLHTLHATYIRHDPYAGFPLSEGYYLIIFHLYSIIFLMNCIFLPDIMLSVYNDIDNTLSIYISASILFDICFYILHCLSFIWSVNAKEFKPDRWNTFKSQTWECRCYNLFDAEQRECVRQQKTLAKVSYIIVRMPQELSEIKSQNDRQWTEQVQVTAKNATECKVALMTA